MWPIISAIGGGVLLLGGAIWAIGRISRKRGEEKIGGKILAKEVEARTKYEKALAARKRLRGDKLRKRLRDMADHG